MAVTVSSTEYWLAGVASAQIMALVTSKDNDIFYVVNHIEGHEMLQGTERTGRLGQVTTMDMSN